jgi:hypothetical protein
MESRTFESLRATPVPEVTSMQTHSWYDEIEYETEQDFDQSLLSLFTESFEQKFDAQAWPRPM